MAKDLVLNIIMKATDKASTAFNKLKQNSGALSGELAKQQQELKKVENGFKKLAQHKELKETLRETKESMRRNREEMRRLEEQTVKNGGANRKAVAEMKRLTAEYQRLDKKRAETIRKTAELGRAMQKEGIDARNTGAALDSLRSRHTAATAAIEKQKAALDKLNKATKDYKRTAERVEKARDFGRGAALRGGLALGGIGAGLAPAVSFEEDFSRVVALQRLDKNKAADAEKIRIQRQQAVDLGATTPYTSGQVAQGQGYLAMAGFNHDQILKAVPHTLNLGIAAGMKDRLGDVSNIMSNIMTGFGLKADEAGRAADVLTATFTRTNTNLEQLGETAAYAAPIMKALGQSYESTNVMAGLLGNVGIQGSMAGTTLKNLGVNLVNPKNIKKLKQDLNVDVANKDGSLREIPAILADIGQAIKDLPNTKQLEIIEGLFGKIPLAGATELIKQMSGGQVKELFDAVQNSRGATAQTAGIMADNVKGDINNLKSALEAVSITIFDQNQPAIRALVGGITDVIRSVNDWVKANPALASMLAKFAVVGLAVVTVLSGLAFAISSVVLPLAMLKFGMSYLFGGISIGLKLVPLLAAGFNYFAVAVGMVGRAFMMNPIGLAITLIGAALYLLYRNWETVKAAIVSGWAYISARFGDNPIVRMVNISIEHFRKFGFNWESIKSLAVRVWSEIKSAIVGNIQSIIGWVGNAIDKFKSFISLGNSARNVRLPAAPAAGVPGFSVGGYTGAGGVNQAAGIVHKGEVVFSQRDVARFGGWRAVEALRRGGAGLLTRFADKLGFSGGGAPRRVAVLSAPRGGFAAAGASFGGDTVNIHIHAAPGMNEAGIADKIRRILDERDAAKRRRANSSYKDRD